MGGGRPSRGGWPSTVARGVWCQAPSLSRLPVSGGGQPGPVAPMSRVRVVWIWGTQHRPRPPVLRAGCRGPLPTCCGRGRAGVGVQHCPFGLHALRGAACRGGSGGPTLGGCPSTVARGVWCQALSPSGLPVPGGGRPGPLARVSRARVMWASGAQHRPHSVRSCEPALSAVGVAGRRPRGGGALCRCEGHLSSGPLPTRLPVLRAGSPDPLPTCCGRGCAGVGAQQCSFGLHALRGAACRRGGGRPSRGGGLPPLLGASGVRRCPFTGRPSLGAGGGGSATHVSRPRLLWAWGPSTGRTACALASRHCALWG